MQKHTLDLVGERIKTDVFIVFFPLYSTVPSLSTQKTKHNIWFTMNRTWGRGQVTLSPKTGLCTAPFRGSSSDQPNHPTLPVLPPCVCVCVVTYTHLCITAKSFLWNRRGCLFYNFALGASLVLWYPFFVYYVKQKEQPVSTVSTVSSTLVYRGTLKTTSECQKPQDSICRG